MIQISHSFNFKYFKIHIRQYLINLIYIYVYEYLTCVVFVDAKVLLMAHFQFLFFKTIKQKQPSSNFS